MSEEEKTSPQHDLIFRLDSERRREIDEIKKRMEEFLREQINVTNELKIVVKGQDALKERFEKGVSERLTNLDKKFDAFIIEWGAKKAEDRARDKAIDDVQKDATANREDLRKYLVIPVITFCFSVLLAVVAYLLKMK